MIRFEVPGLGSVLVSPVPCLEFFAYVTFFRAGLWPVRCEATMSCVESKEQITCDDCTAAIGAVLQTMSGASELGLEHRSPNPHKKQAPQERDSSKKESTRQEAF